MSAVLRGRPEILVALSRAGGGAHLRLGSQPRLNRTCLHMAVELGGLETVRVLAEAGGEDLLLRPKEPLGWTCLHVACSKGQMDIVRFLAAVAGGVLLRTPDRSGNTALHVAAASGPVAVVEHLVALAGDLAGRVNCDGESALDLARRAGRGRVCAALLREAALGGRTGAA